MDKTNKPSLIQLPVGLFGFTHAGHDITALNTENDNTENHITALVTEGIRQRS